MIRRFLSATALLALAAATAQADDNAARLDQDGASNTALIVQDGTNNIAGDDTDAIRQDGAFNEIDIWQRNVDSPRPEDGNMLGTGGNYAQNNRGVDQIGDRNALSVDQSLQSRTFMVQQDASAATGSPVGTTNSATLRQTGNMRINQVLQTYSGDGAPGSGNTLEIVQTGSQFQRSWVGNRDGLRDLSEGAFQTGAGNGMGLLQTGPNNAMRRAAQTGIGNTMSVTQDGADNVVARAEQAGIANRLSLSFAGSGNGVGTFSAGALAVGLGVATYDQSGFGNYAGLDIMGAENRTALLQSGFGNQIGSGFGTALAITGQRNELAVSQTVGPNAVYASLFDGNDNVIGVIQNGLSNSLELSLLGDENGGKHGFATGSDAATIGLSAGLLEQQGDNNMIDLNVDGTGNVFAILQDGDANEVSGAQDGNFNQVAIHQLGVGHSTTFNQIGNANVLGVRQ